MVEKRSVLIVSAAYIHVHVATFRRFVVHLTTPQAGMHAMRLARLSLTVHLQLKYLSLFQRFLTLDLHVETRQTNTDPISSFLTDSGDDVNVKLDDVCDVCTHLLQG